MEETELKKVLAEQIQHLAKINNELAGDAGANSTGLAVAEQIRQNATTIAYLTSIK